MKNFYSAKIKAYSISLILFVSFFGLSQNKSLSIPNYSNPFQKRTVRNIQEPIRPTIQWNESSIKKFELIDGSFYANFKTKQVNEKELMNQINMYLDLSDDFTFSKISERIDTFGIRHINYQQIYKGFNVDNCLIMTHSKNGVINSINGRVFNFEKLSTEISISKEEALSKAKQYLQVTDLINEYPIETLIIQQENGKKIETFLAHKVRIDSWSPFEMCYVYIDVNNGKVINKINLVAHADVSGTGQTMYKGTQNITVDSYQGNYRLKDNARQIQTFDATNAYDLDNSGFVGSVDFINNTTTFSGIPILKSFKVSNVAQNWWYTVIADEQPDLYIVIKDASNQTVYTSGYYNNTFPPVTWNNIDLMLTNPPYIVELWDYDAVGSDDFGGSYTITSSSNGTFTWSGSGNNGNYTISNTGHPAIDVHWGMEMTYDFYSDIFSRDSYDGNGSIIKQYLNSPLTQVIHNGDPNNAFAMNAPYNIMVYGMGDGSYMGPVVALDVEGHEFTHLVINNNGNGGLVYEGESGALNESFADIMGTCVEIYAGINPNWTIGEDVMVSQPFLRSMSNPNGAQQPDTYDGMYWQNPSNINNDHGGVHTNSGVQNYWFYLLSQGGSGTNDLGNSYSVTGIGVNNAMHISYRNLMNYLTPNATYMDAYYGSLQATEDYFGNPSTEYTAVKEAWYAVGIGTNPNSYCDGITELTAPSGTITDGSGSANYNNNSECTWVITPAGATQISLDFTYFDTESGYDSVVVYNGPDENYPVLATWWGNTLPPTINTTSGVGAMCVKFFSDYTVTKGGWSANYQAYGQNPTCGGDGELLTTPNGSFNDGSGSGNYGNNQECYWFIAPPCASTVTLSFTAFDTEQNYDGLIILDGWDSNANQIAVLTGSSIPNSVTSTTGKMVVIFVSDFMNSAQGFSANYTSTGSAYCSGTTVLNSSDHGTISDGSGANNYCDNQDCSWLIQPQQATSITLNFTEFELEDSPVGNSEPYDFVEIYDGATTSSPLLGRFSGSNIPSNITSTGGSMLVHFVSDISVNKQGFTANYSSTQNSYCSGTTNLTAPSGSFSDGSGTNKYANNSDCSWLINPANATSITLSFTSFDVESNNDGVIVYDGADETAPIIGQFSGTSIPSPVTSSGGSMYVRFLTNDFERKQGWDANYTSNITTVAPVTNFNVSNTNFCEGSCVNFTDISTNSPTSWNWSFPGGTPSSSNSKNPSNICYNTAGVYDVILTTSNDGGSDTKTMTGYITVNPIPNIPTITVNEFNLTSSSSTGNQWYYNGSPISGATTQSIVADQNGEYYVVVTNNNCSSQSESITISAVSIDDFEFSNKQVKLYPNPTKDFFIVDSQFDENIQLEIFDLTGKQIQNQISIKKGLNTIELSQVSKGIYLVKITNKKGYHLLEKLIVE